MRRSGVRFISPAPIQKTKARYSKGSGLCSFGGPAGFLYAPYVKLARASPKTSGWRIQSTLSFSPPGVVSCSKSAAKSA